MELTIIPEDGLTILDGAERTFSLATLNGLIAPLVAPDITPPFVVHAVHWDTVSGIGEIEFDQPTVNVQFVDTGAFTPILTLYNANPNPTEPPKSLEENIETLREFAVRAINEEQLEARLLDGDTPQEVIDWDTLRQTLP